jgi:glycosyltransferase involved in cell wall biosynthesis
MSVIGATANNAMLEAMACGATVIAERIGGLAEYLGDTGCLIQKGAVDELLDHVERLGSDGEKLQREKARAVARAREFDWERVARATAEYYAFLGSTIDIHTKSGTVGDTR